MDDMQKMAVAVLDFGIEAADYLRNSPKVMGPLLKAGGAAIGGTVGSAAGPVGGAIGGIKGYQLGLDLARAMGADKPAEEAFPAKKDAGLAYDVGTFAEQNIAPVAQLGLELSDPTFFLRKLGTGAVANVAEKQAAGVAPAAAVAQTIEENAPTAMFLGAGPVMSKLAKAVPNKLVSTAIDYAVPGAAFGKPPHGSGAGPDCRDAGGGRGHRRSDMGPSTGDRSATAFAFQVGTRRLV